MYYVVLILCYNINKFYFKIIVNLIYYMLYFIVLMKCECVNVVEYLGKCYNFILYYFM